MKRLFVISKLGIVAVTGHLILNGSGGIIGAVRSLSPFSGEGHVDAVRTLLAKGANPELGDRSGHRALMVASKTGHVE